MNAHRTVSEEIRWSNSQSGSIQSNSLRDQSLQWYNVDHRLMAIKECEEEEDKRDSQIDKFIGQQAKLTTYGAITQTESSMPFSPGSNNVNSTSQAHFSIPNDTKHNTSLSSDDDNASNTSSDPRSSHGNNGLF